MRWVVDVNVGARAWIRRFHLLITWPLVAAMKSSTSRLLCDNLVLYVVLFLLVVILTRSWNLGESLSGVRRLSFVLPELASLSLRQEGLRLLPNKLPV